MGERGMAAGTQSEYFSLYATTSVAIKQVCPTCQVGGPAVRVCVCVCVGAFMAVQEAPCTSAGQHSLCAVRSQKLVAGCPSL